MSNNKKLATAKEMKRRAMFALFPQIPDEQKNHFEKDAGMTITRPTLIAQAIRRAMKGNALPVLFSPTKVE